MKGLMQGLMKGLMQVVERRTPTTCKLLKDARLLHTIS